ncbi:MAG TPA: hypothetical protein VL501_09215 [Pyrinomonadaceae bacterium]|nr:hypothetical protein [Pyrinomonadaceae bacterium]
MTTLPATFLEQRQIPRLAFSLLLCLAALQIFAATLLAHPEISTSDDDTTVIVGEAPEQEVYVIGKSVEVKKSAKGVLAIGGDVVIEGRIEGDVATIGGNVIQKQDAYIGGDVIVFGGSYKPEAQQPLRQAGKETVMFGAFEDELRSFGQNPSSLFSPTLSFTFVAQRLVLALFWFIISIVLTTLAPGAVGRAVARINLHALKVCAFGAVVFLLMCGLMITGAVVLPNYLSVTLALMGMLFFLLSYVFGRVSLQVSAGKWLQKHFLSEANRSETLATLLGVAVWTLMLSLPYVWLIALFVVFTFGIGLILTGRTSPKWQAQ